LFKTFQIMDDRGTTVRVPTPGLTVPRLNQLQDADNVWKLHRRVRWTRHTARSRVIRASLGAAVVLLTLMAVQDLQEPMAPSSQAVLSLVLAALGWFFFVFWKPYCSWSNRRWERALGKAIPVCASCGYVLGSLPAASDGCTLCPECGAAWKLGTPPASQRPARGGDG